MNQSPRNNELTLIIGDLADGGAQRVVTTLANYWARKGRRIAVITLADPTTDYFALDPRVDRLTSGGIGASQSISAALLASFARLRSLRKKLREARSPTAMAFVGATNVLTILAAAGLGMRVVISERNDPARQSLGPIWNGLRRLVYPFASLITANSQSALTSLSSYIPKRKLGLVRNPVSRPSSPQRPSPEPLILTVGRLVPQKGQDILLTAFSKIATEAPEWQLVIIGEGPDGEYLRNRAQDLGIDDRTIFTGRTDPWPYYARASVFALPSHYEGTSNALLEAMSMGIAPVVSDTSRGNLALVEDGKNGMVIAQDDTTALAAVLRDLISDANTRQRLGRAAAQKVSAFTPAAIAAEWEALLGLVRDERRL